MSKPRRSVLMSVVAVAALLTLAACAPAARAHHPVSTPTGIGKAGPTSSATPKPVRLAPPVVRYPFGCAQIAPTPTLATALGHALTIEGPPSIGSLNKYIYVQDGALDCEYVSTTAGDQTDFTVDVMPDVASSLFTTTEVGAGTTPSPFGANSYLNCDAPQGNLLCNLDILIGSSWLSITSYSSDAGTLTDAQVLGRMQPILQNAITLVKNATVKEPLWTDATATAVTGTTDDVAEDQRLASVMGLDWGDDVFSPDLIANGPTVQPFIPVHAYFRGGGSTDYNIAMSMLPAGGWAWSQVVSANSGQPGYTTLTGLGDKAIAISVTSADEPYESTIFGTKGHNLYSVEVSTTNVADGPGIQTIAKQVATAVLTEIG